jgi:hypothetical protein
MSDANWDCMNQLVQSFSFFISIKKIAASPGKPSYEKVLPELLPTGYEMAVQVTILSMYKFDALAWLYVLLMIFTYECN